MMHDSIQRKITPWLVLLFAGAMIMISGACMAGSKQAGTAGTSTETLAWSPGACEDFIFEFTLNYDDKGQIDTIDGVIKPPYARSTAAFNLLAVPGLGTPIVMSIDVDGKSQIIVNGDLTVVQLSGQSGGPSRMLLYGDFYYYCEKKFEISDRYHFTGTLFEFSGQEKGLERREQSSKVDPLMGVNRMIADYEGQSLQRGAQNKARQQRLAILKENKRRKNVVLWAEKMIKDQAYYSALSTKDLAVEVFGDGIFAAEMRIYDDRDLGFQRLEAWHTGFAELFSREDCSKGVLAAYEALMDNLNQNSTLSTIVRTARALDALTYLYGYPPFKSRIKGREALFLHINQKVLKGFMHYLDTYSPEKLGTTIPVYAAPASVARVALMLKSQVAPEGYHNVMRQMAPERWKDVQDISDVKRFLVKITRALE